MVYDANNLTAAISALGAAVVAFGSLALRRRWNVQDRREDAEHRCEELQSDHARLCEWAERIRAGIVEVARCLSLPGEADQARGRAMIQLLATEPPPLKQREPPRRQEREADEGESG